MLGQFSLLVTSTTTAMSTTIPTGFAGHELSKMGICINEYGEDAGIFNMDGVESSYGLSGHQFYIL